MDTPLGPLQSVSYWLTLRLVDVIRDLPPEVWLMKAIAAANVIRVCRRPDGRELCDVAVAVRVGGILPSEVAAIRAQIEQNGYLAEEVSVSEEQRGGRQ